jgi:hypothetical protein
MNLRPGLITLALVAQACATQRSIVARPYVPSQDPPLEASWTLSNLSVAPPLNPDLANQQFATMLTQIETHVHDALANEPALGHHEPSTRNAQYAVEVDVRLVEGDGINGFTGITMGSSVLPAAGLLIGGLAAPAGPAGLLIGAGVGGLVTLGVNLAVPRTTHAGTLEATMRVRRAADGVEVAQRTCRSTWTVDLNAFAREEKLAVAAGDAVPELEHELVKSLRSVFASLDAPTLTAQE